MDRRGISPVGTIVGAVLIILAVVAFAFAYSSGFFSSSCISGATCSIGAVETAAAQGLTGIALLFAGGAALWRL
jgi:hypothetical protein